MTKISDVANKFAMKLGLEPRSSLPPSDPTYTNTFTGELEAPEEISEDELRYIGKKPDSDIREHLTSIRITMHDLAQKLDFSDWGEALELIDNAMYDLSEMKALINHKVSKKASIKYATLPYDEPFLNPHPPDSHPYDATFFNPNSRHEPRHLEEDDEETTYQEMEEPPTKLKILPSVMDEYLRTIYYMNPHQLWEERQKIRKMIRQFENDGLKPPFPLKIRLEEVEKRLKPKI